MTRCIMGTEKTLNPMADEFPRGNVLVEVGILFVAFAMSSWLSVRIVNWLSWKPHWVYLGVAVAMAVVAVYRRRANRLRDDAPPLTPWTIGFCLLWIGLEAILYFIKWDLGPTPVFKAHLVSAVLLVCFLFAMGDRALWRHAQWGVRLGVITGVLICLAQVYLPGLLTDWDQPRSTGLANNPNSAAFAIAFGYFATIWAIPARYRVPYTALCLSGLLATMSRTHLLAFTVGVAVLAVFGHFRGVRAGRQVLAALALISLFFTLAYATQPIFRFGVNGQFGLMPEAIDYLEREVRQPSPNTHLAVPDSQLQRLNLEKEVRQPSPNTPSAVPDSQLQRLSLVVRADRMIKGGKLLEQLPRFGIVSVQEAAELSGHNAHLFYLLAYGFAGVGLFPLLLLALWGVKGDKRILVPFSAALLVAAVGFQDPLADWGRVIFGASLLYMQARLALRAGDGRDGPIGNEQENVGQV